MLKVYYENSSEFNKKFNEHKDMLYGFISKKFYSQLLPFEVDEIVSATFEKFANNKEKILNSDTNIPGWLVSVSKNLVLDLLRKRKTKSAINFIPFEDSKEVNLELYSRGFLDNNFAFSCDLEYKKCEFISFLKNAIYTLPYPYNEYIKLHYLSNKQYADIGTIYPNDDVVAIRRKVRRGRMILKNKFQKHYDSIYNQAYMF